MKKTYEKFTNCPVNEAGEPIGEVNEIIVTTLHAEKGKKMHHIPTGVTAGTAVTLGSDAKEEDYTEVDDPAYIEVISEIVNEVSK